MEGNKNMSLLDQKKKKFCESGYVILKKDDVSRILDQYNIDEGVNEFNNIITENNLISEVTCPPILDPS
jgi:hypothetical protein